MEESKPFVKPEPSLERVKSRIQQILHILNEIKKFETKAEKLCYRLQITLATESFILDSFRLPDVKPLDSLCMSVDQHEKNIRLVHEDLWEKTDDALVDVYFSLVDFLWKYHAVQKNISDGKA